MLDDYTLQLAIYNADGLEVLDSLHVNLDYCGRHGSVPAAVPQDLCSLEVCQLVQATRTAASFLSIQRYALLTQVYLLDFLSTLDWPKLVPSPHLYFSGCMQG